MISLIISIISLAIALFCLIRTRAAQAAAVAAVADTIRLDQMMDNRYSLVAGQRGDDWAVVDGMGKVIGSGSDLRTLMDAAHDELETRTNG